MPSRLSSMRANARKMMSVIMMSLESSVDMEVSNAWLKKLLTEALPDSRNDANIPHEMTMLSAQQTA